MAAPTPHAIRVRHPSRPTWSTRMLAVIQVLALALAVPTTAASQLDDGRAPGEEAFPYPGQKNAGTAVALSVAGTLLPVIATLRGQSMALGAAGMALGPALGDAYLGDWDRVASRSTLRAGVMAATVGLAAAACTLGCDILGGDQNGWLPATIALIAGTVVTAELARRDIAGLSGRVQAHNARAMAEHEARLARERPRVRMTPTVDPLGRTLGLIVSVR